MCIFCYMIHAYSLNSISHRYLELSSGVVLEYAHALKGGQSVPLALPALSRTVHLWILCQQAIAFPWVREVVALCKIPRLPSEAGAAAGVAQRVPLHPGHEQRGHVAGVPTGAACPAQTQRLRCREFPVRLILRKTCADSPDIPTDTSLLPQHKIIVCLGNFYRKY